MIKTENNIIYMTREMRNIYCGIRLYHSFTVQSARRLSCPEHLQLLSKYDLLIVKIWIRNLAI